MPGLTDGRVFSGRQALELKLVDEIGGEERPSSWLAEEARRYAGLSVVDWKPERESGGLFGWLFACWSRASSALAAERIAGLRRSNAARQAASLTVCFRVWHAAVS